MIFLKQTVFGHNPGQNRKGRNIAAFTLIELLVVIGIVVVLMALLAPAFRTIGGAQDLSSGADMVAANFELARQAAQTENRRIELRLWNLPDPSGTGSAYRALQLFRVDNGQPLDKAKRLPQNIIMMTHDTFSSLMSDANPYGGTGDLSGFKTRAFKSVRFGPDGSTELSPNGPGTTINAWTVTVINQNAPTTNAARPADNFATIQVDPITGRSLVYRP